MSTWSYTTHGRRDAVIAHVKGLIAEGCRTTPLPSAPTITKDSTVEDQRAIMVAHGKALDADALLWNEAKVVFERTKKFVVEQLATYTPDAIVGVLVRLHLSPVGPPASEELFVSISEHLPPE